MESKQQKKVLIWETKLIKVKNLLPNENNPRTITKEKLEKLQTQIQRVGFNNPPKIDNNGVLLGGNQRFKAMIAAGYGEVEIPIMIPPKKLTEKQRQEIIITDNISDGTWDYDKLANEFELEDLKEWGLDLPDIEELNLSDKNKEIDIDELDTSECKIVFKFDALTYESISSRIRKLKEENNFETNEILLLELLHNYES